MNKRDFSERDICTKLITPSLLRAGWTQNQFREEVNLTQGRVVVRGKIASRIKNRDKKGGPKRADYVLYGKPNIALAALEAKRNKYPLGTGMGQALRYAEMLDAPFAISSNGNAFLIHDRTGITKPTIQKYALEDFPSQDDLWAVYRQWKELPADDEKLNLLSQPYHNDGSGKEPRYYQKVAINRAVNAVINGQKRMMLVMATGTGKTYTAFQIIWRLWKAKRMKRILFLADRNILVDQTIQQDFAPFGEVMHKIGNREAKKNYEIYLSLYQAVTGKETEKQIFRDYPKDFFDLIVIDECHRGSASEDSSWRTILEYFDGATHVGLTATPKEKQPPKPKKGEKRKTVISDPEFNYKYFGNPIYVYSLAQGIDDGFLAPYKIIRVVPDVDAVGYTPEKDKRDKEGQLIENRQFTTLDFDRNMILTQRTEFVANRVWEYMSENDPMAKTIIFCDDQAHAERMRQAMVKLIPEAASNRRYVVRITGDDKEGKALLSYFIDNDEPFPVIATTSRLLSTGVDAKTCKLIVLDQTINSMTQFKQIVGRGSRIREDYNKLYFTIMDFKGATRLFFDPEFDGEPLSVVAPDEGLMPSDDETEEGEPVPNDDDQEDEDWVGGGEGDEDEDDTSGGEVRSPRTKYIVNDVAVGRGIERSMYLDENGRLITESHRVHLKDDIKRCIVGEFQTLQDFFRRWSEAERKKVVVNELDELGIDINVLREAIPDSDRFDVFDLVAHIAFDAKPLTRQERANKVKKRNYFAKYGDEARAVLEALLEKYADHGIIDIEDAKILELPPFTEFGTRTQIRRGIFGGNDKYSEALTQLEKALYEMQEAA